MSMLTQYNLPTENEEEPCQPGCSCSHEDDPIEVLMMGRYARMVEGAGGYQLNDMEFGIPEGSYLAQEYLRAFFGEGPRPTYRAWVWQMTQKYRDEWQRKG